MVPVVQRPLVRLPPVSAFGFSSLREAVRNMTRPQKVVIMSVGTGLALVALVARYLRRRKRRLPKKSALYNPDDPNRAHRKVKPITIRSPSGEIHSVGGNVSPGFHRSVHHRHSSISVSSDRTSVASTLGPQGGDANPLTPQQYGVMGMEALETALGYWEDALAAYTSGLTGGVALTSQDEAEFTALLQRVIDDAYSLQDQCEHLFLHQHSVLFRSSSVTPVVSEAAFEHLERRTLTSASSYESFVSASGDIADLRDLEEFDEAQYPLYLAALKQHEDGGIPYRDVRADRVRVASDVEYVCKVHCIRLACHLLFAHEDTKLFFADAGRQIIGDLLVRAAKDPKDALQAYDAMLDFLTECDWGEVESELQGRGVKALTFYDVVLDFILMDAFEDLENPPSSVTAVVQNRWLSNGFKESALSTAVWSVLRAKRRMLKYHDGFIAHFYDVSEHLSPVLAWGFLGPDENMREMCTFFKDQIVGLLQDLFSFSSVRYTTVEELATDVMNLTKERFQVINQKLAL